jgi:serine/threonine protein kinase
MVCLLRVGIGGEDAQASGPEGSTPSGDEHFGVYVIERHADGSLCELGRGAMGVTYRAVDTSLQRRVALKVIITGIAGRRIEASERFMREARAAAALRHENIATVFQFGICEETGQCFYAMELIEGETLDERVRRTGPLDVRTVTDIAQQATAALAAAEKRGLIHRDLKPANLMLMDRDETKFPLVKIIDFGLAKVLNAPLDPMRLTHDGFVGTPAFASPEQFQNESLDVRSDIYSLGVTLWFALTGKTPFGGHNVEEIHRAQQVNALPIEQLKAARVLSQLRLLIKSMLALEPAARPSTHDLAARLRRCSAQVAGVRRTCIVLAAAAILVLGTSTFFISYSLQTHPAANGSVSSLPVQEKSIAVLPFENLSRDPDNAFFADGVQGEILGDLSRIADLKVIGRTSVRQYKSGVARDLHKISQQLGVAHVVEGNVQRSDNRVRVNAQLVDARTNRHLWAQTYDRDLADVFAIQSEIARAIANELRAKLSPTEKSEIEHRPTSDMTAYELYLKGRSLWGKRGGDNIRQAIALYEQAIARDSNYAAAYAGLADAYILLPGYTATAPREANPKAKTAALKALQLDETLAEAHTALAEVLLYGDLNMAGSISEFQRAIALNPSYATAHHWYGGDSLSALGRSEEAIAEGKRAVELDPLSSIINADFGWILIQARRFDEAIVQLRKTLEIDPAFYYAHYRLGMALQAKGDLSAAIAEYTKAQQLSDDMFVPVLLAAAKAQSGDKEPSVRMLTELEELSQHGYVRPYWRALLYLSLGNRGEAIRWLDQSVADREGADIAAIKVDPLLDPLHGNPRFEALVQKVIGAEQR